MKKLSKEELSRRISRPIAPTEVKDPETRPNAEQPEKNLDTDDNTEHERDNRSVKGKKGMSHP